MFEGASERRKVAASIIFNIGAKVPAIAGLLFIMPLASTALGVSLYGQMLSMLAIGAACSIAFSGVNASVRRLIGTARGETDRQKERSVFWTTLAAVATLVPLSAAVALSLALQVSSSRELLLVACIPILAAGLNVLDNVRAAYNEHYVTAAFLAIFQVGAIFLVYCYGLPTGGVLASALSLTAPYIIASIFSALVLFFKRPYLLRYSHPLDIRGFAGNSSLIAGSDGAISWMMNMSVYFLSASGADAAASWYGTLNRLFQAALSPALLVSLPIGSYAANRWPVIGREKRIRLKKIFAAVGIAYGASVALGTLVFGSTYMKEFFPKVPSLSSDVVICLCLYYFGMTSQKVYAQLIYSVQPGRALSLGTVGILGAGSAVALALLSAYDAITAINALSAGVGVGLVLLVGSLGWKG